MRLRHRDEGLVWLAEVASTCGKVSIDATRCEICFDLRNRLKSLINGPTASPSGAS
jgi:hypothetical protein